MKMSANENESMDLRFYANRRTNLIDLEELNRMERPSRVFSSRHHLSVSGSTDTNNMEQNEEFRRSRDYNRGSPSNATQFEGSSTSNGDTARNRWPFIRFTVTDIDPNEIISGHSQWRSSPQNAQSSAHTNNNDSAPEVVDGDDSEDEASRVSVREYFERRSEDHFRGLLPSPLPRYSRSGRRSRRFLEHPYLTRSHFENSISNIRSFRRVRFFAPHNNHSSLSPERSQTPEQELPEVLDQDMDQEIQFEQYPGEESMSSVSSHNDEDSGDERRPLHFSNSENHESNTEEENRDVLNLSNETETPRIRAVPFIISPTPFSSRAESPPGTSDDPVVSRNSNGSRLSFAPSDEDDDHTEAIDLNSALAPLMNLIPPQIPDFVSDVLINRPVTETVSSNGAGSSMNDGNEINSGLPHPSTSVEHSLEQPRVIEETVSLRTEEHPETYEDLNEQLTRLFECPVCFEHIAIPVYQCCVGHLICHKCVIMCETCPTCRNPFNSKRNLYMEKVAYLLKFPCRNALTGCKEQMFVSQKELHEQDCGYRHYQCFFTNCGWKGYYPELEVHMTQNHTNNILNGPEQFFDILLPINNQTYKWFVKAFGEYFTLIIHISGLPRRGVKAQVNYIGSTVGAKNFTFTITLTQSVRPIAMSQKLMYMRSTLPYSEIYEISNNNSQSSDIFSLPIEVLNPFIKRRHNRRLPLNLKIERASSNSV